MYNFREACKHTDTIVKSVEHKWDLALRPNYPLLHHNYTSAPSIPLLALAGNASRYSPLHIPPLHLQLQWDQEGLTWHILLSKVIIERHEKLDAHPGLNHASPIYKQHYKLYELHSMDQPIVVAAFLILLGVAGFMWSAIPNTLQKIALSNSESHKTASRLLKLWAWHP